MKLKLLFLSSLLAASAAFAQEKPAVMQVAQLLTSEVEAVKGRECAIHGSVDLVSAARGMFTITDPSEAGCADGCAKPTVVAKLPQNLKAQLPQPKDEVVAVGKLEETGRGYVFAVSKLAVGPEQIKALTLK